MSNIRVLIADDHVLVREGLSRLLEKEPDIECIALAQDGEEAVKLAKKLVPDIVILDVSMPKMSGIQAVREIKKACPTTAVLVLSAYKYDHYVVACAKAGAQGYLLKRHLPSDAIARAVRMLHAGEVVYDREVNRILLRRLAGKNEAKESQGGLGKREFEVLQLLIEGKSNKEIASELSISTLTVGTHVANIFKRLGVKSRTEAVAFALKQGLVGPDEPGGEDETGLDNEKEGKPSTIRQEGVDEQ